MSGIPARRRRLLDTAPVLVAVSGAAVALLAAALLAVCAMGVPPARADGDPGSDVLLAQNLFAGHKVSVPAQLQLARLLDATARAGAPVRVAIITERSDLGAVTQLWRRPARTYAQFLATELADTYPGRLLVVMPSGVGVYWSAERAAIPRLEAALASVRVTGGSGADLVSATKSAIYRLEGVAGVDATALTKLMRSGGPTGGGSASAVASTPATPGRSQPAGQHHQLPSGIFAAIVVLVFVVYFSYRRGWWPALRGAVGRAWEAAGAGRALRRAGSAEAGTGRSGEPRRFRIRPVALLPALLLVIVVAALAINQGSGRSSQQPARELAENPGLDSGTQLGGDRQAPSFTLTDETGRPISLRQYRGKVVILSFVDAECQTLCPLTTQAMLDAKRSLGAAGADVQLLGVNANYRSTQVEDVLEYTEVHGLGGQWHFLTGPEPKLARVWKAYGVDEAALIKDDSRDIDHVAATYVIAPDGQERTVYTTYSQYTAIPQLGQELAREASALLPSHPRVDSDYSYAAVRGIRPTQATILPRSGGGSVALGPGRPHLYLFFDTWDRQSTPIAAELSLLNGYQRSAAALGLPSLTAIDEGSVEPSPAALPAFLEALPAPLDYPVAIDRGGRVADGYEVQGEPWLVLTSAAGRILWEQEVYTEGWPKSVAALEDTLRLELSRPAANTTSSALAGSPAPLAALHAQSSKLLSGGSNALRARVAALRGYPVVVNIWDSWCPPCQAEFGLFAKASNAYGKRVAFLGADIDDEPGAAEAFLAGHQVAYPSYAEGFHYSLSWLLPGGLQGTPTTIFIGPNGHVVYRHTGQYQSQSALDADIERYALASGGR